jgi:hypothetical protein
MVQNSRNKQVLSFWLCAVLGSVMKSCIAPLSPA